MEPRINNLIFPFVVIVFIAIGIKISDSLVAAGKISKNTSRKLIHIRVSNRALFRYFAYLDHRTKRIRVIPPILFVIIFIVKSRAPPDDPFVRSMSRTGDPKELLGGTFYFTIMATILMLTYVLVPKLRVRAIMANVVLGRGDGLAALTGGYIRIGSRSLSGTLGFIVGALIAGVFYLRLFGFDITIEYLVYPIIVGAIAELITPGGYDNITVPLSVLILGAILEFL